MQQKKPKHRLKYSIYPVGGTWREKCRDRRDIVIEYYGSEVKIRLLGSDKYFTEEEIAELKSEIIAKRLKLSKLLYNIIFNDL